MTINEMITNKILERIEEAEKTGKPFYWVKPWTGGAKFPLSYTTQKYYSGVNFVSLDAGEYITYKALMEYKGSLPEDEAEKIHIKKGCHKAPVYYFGKMEGKDIVDSSGIPTGKKETDHWYMKYYSAFNIEDVVGLPSHFPAKHYEHTPTENAERLHKYIEAYAEAEDLKVDIVKDGSRCFYRPSDHLVRVPDESGFKTAYGYYGSLLHEIVHSTSKGMKRDVNNGFGDDGYSKEELIAEIGSQMLLNYFEIIAEDEKEELNDVAYIKGWSDHLKDNKGEIVKASCQAEKAMKYFIDIAEKQLMKERAEGMKEIALQYEDGFLFVQEAGDGTYFDYTVFNQDKIATDGGQMDYSDNISNCLECAKDILSDLKVDVNCIKEIPTFTLTEKNEVLLESR